MRTALITGGSRGIGHAIAAELDKRGWQLFLVAQHAIPARATEGFCNITGTVGVDLGEGETAARAVAAAFPGEALDLLVLDAGIFIEGALGAVDESNYRRNMAVNLDANVLLVKHLLPRLQKGTKARIVIIGSTAAYEAYPLVPTYGIAKWALRGFAVNLRRELVSQGIGVTLLSPGGTLTDMWEGEELPSGRLLEPRDVGLLVAAVVELSSQAVVEEIVVRPMLGDIHE